MMEKVKSKEELNNKEAELLAPSEMLELGNKEELELTRLEKAKKELETKGKVNMNEMAMVLTTDEMGKLMLKELEEMDKLKLAKMKKAKKQKQAMMDMMEEAKYKEELELIKLIKKAKIKKELKNKVELPPPTKMLE